MSQPLHAELPDPLAALPRASGCPPSEFLQRLPDALDLPQLLDALSRGVLVVVPGARAARALRDAFDQHQSAAGALAWDSAPVLSWSSWTRSLWSSLVTAGHEARLLLNSAQEHLLWIEVITASSANQSLSTPAALAELAARSWALAAAYRAPVAQVRSFANTHDSRAFAGWAAQFERLCAAHACLSAARLEDALREHAAAGWIAMQEPEQPILLAGFLELNPAQTALLEALGSSGASIAQRTLVAPQAKAPPGREGELRAAVLAPTPYDERLLAVRWLRRFLEQRAAGSLSARIAVIPLGSSADLAGLECLFREVLAPELQNITADLSSTPWEFGSGPPLASHPLVSTALDLLRWARGSLSIDRIGALLRSPFVGSLADHAANARFDAFSLRSRAPLRPELTLAELRRQVAIYLARDSRPPAPAPWLAAFTTAAGNLFGGAPERTFAAWAEDARALLRAASFPGERAPTVAELEMLRAWESTLDLLATLDFRGRRIPFAEALATLERLAHSTPSPAPHTAAPVQVMSLAEAEGSLFDAVILLGATDQAWPQPSLGDPLLGWPLQRQLGLPGSSSAQDAERTRQQAMSLLARTGAALITCAEQDAQGRLRPSALIAELEIPLVPAAALALADDSSSGMLSAPVTEELFDDAAPLPPPPSSRVSGGARVLQLQAACGFQAFAELRLRASALDDAALGLDARARGSLVHHALELFWNHVGSQEALHRMTTAERDKTLMACIDDGLQRFVGEDPWSSAYLALERERLRSLLTRWLQKELDRPAFTVLQPEKDEVLVLGPLDLHVRLDRIDKLEDGGLVFIDYKTGYTASPQGWTGDRPDEPQLPLYALLPEPGELKGLLFGRVVAGEKMGWLGLQSGPGALPASSGTRSDVDLKAQVEAWRGVLTTLAEDFAEGRADVDPKDAKKTCDRCAQRLLCRIDPALFSTAGDLGEDYPDAMDWAGGVDG